MIELVHKEQLKEDGIKGENDDWEIHEGDLDVILPAWLHYHFSEREHYPEAGGYFDQEVSVTLDFNTLDWIYQCMRLQYLANAAEKGIGQDTSPQL